MSFSYPKETRKTCRHLFTDGHRCGSPALTEEPFCYYHHTTRKPITNPKSRRSRQSTFTLPRCEDRSSIQHSIGEIIHHLTQNTLDTRRAGLLLYALQTASHNLPKPDPNAKPVDILSTIHSDIVDDPPTASSHPNSSSANSPTAPNPSPNSSWATTSKKNSASAKKYTNNNSKKKPENSNKPKQTSTTLNPQPYPKSRLPPPPPPQSALIRAHPRNPRCALAHPYSAPPKYPLNPHQSKTLRKIREEGGTS